MTTMLEISQQALAQELFNIGAIRFGANSTKRHQQQPDFPPSPIYFNLRTPRHPTAPGPLMPRQVREIALELFALVQKQHLTFDALVGLPDTGPPFAEQLVALMDRAVPCLHLAKETQEGGRKITSIQDNAGLHTGTVVLVDDVLSGGESKLEAIQVLEEGGYTVQHILVSVDREQGGRELLEAKGYQVHAWGALRPLIDLFVRSERISHQQAEKIRAYRRLSLGEISKQDYLCYP